MDVWLPTLAPSAELLDWVGRSNLDESKRWSVFIERYRKEMQKTPAKQTIHLIAKLAQRTPVAIGCYCDGTNCHRFELERIIRAAAAGRF